MSVDGRVYVWKIIEDPDEENKPQITGEVIVAMQMMGYDYSIHPRVCWHSHKQVACLVQIKFLFLMN